MLELSVNGMTCNSCVASVTRAVRGVDSKAGVEVDLSSGLVRIDGNASKDEVVRAISAAGYEAKVADGTARTQAPRRGCCCG